MIHSIRIRAGVHAEGQPSTPSESDATPAIAETDGAAPAPADRDKTKAESDDDRVRLGQG